MTLENKVNSKPDLLKFVQVGFEVGLEFDNSKLHDNFRQHRSIRGSITASQSNISIAVVI